MPLQHTIGKPVSLSGTGLHTGEEAVVTLHPAGENHGIKFVRTDIENAPVIEADIDNVVDLERGTTIGKDGIKIATIEHLMAAFAGLEIDNCRVEVGAPELPLMDGSAEPFVNLILEAGRKEQPAQREFIKIDEPVLLYQNSDTAYAVFPSNYFHLTLMIDYKHKHPVLSAQHTTLFSLKDFAKEFAPARTFCFLSEIETLREKGLIKGGSFDSAVVVEDVELTDDHIGYIRKLFDYKGPITRGKNGFVNDVELRYYNELCRHKALDLVGDLYLLGKPLLGHIQAACTGHAANHTMAKKIREYVKERDAQKKHKKPMINFQDILGLLPHRYPFLLVDKVLEVEPDRRILAAKNVSFNDNFFQGHFPGNPVMPGVLQIEAIAQAAGIMGLYGKEADDQKEVYFLGVDRARFRDVVRPGDVMHIEVEMLQNRRGTIKFAGKCKVDGRVSCEMEGFAMLVKKDGRK